MDIKETKLYFECIWEIWRDITLLEFLMRASIAKKDWEMELFPKPPYTKWKKYDKYPKSFHTKHSFEIIINKFNKRYPEIFIPKEILDLRNWMAHGVMASIENGIEQVIKFKTIENELVIEFEMWLELSRLQQIRQSIKELKWYLMKIASD